MPPRAVKIPAFPNPPSSIRLVPVGSVPAIVLERLRAGLGPRFGAPIAIDPAAPIEARWFDAARDQFRGDAILDRLVLDRCDREWRLGIVDADLYVPGLNFIFGQATVGGCCAVIGLARLRDAFRGDPSDDDRFHRRALIEAVHELGHVAGLTHCPDPACAMHFSEDIDDTDRKGPDFCPRCTGSQRRRIPL